jgi:hypothetical protein
MSGTSYTLLDSEWPAFDVATHVPAHIIETISSTSTGLGLSTNLGYFSIGHFFIDVDLVQQHSTQRPISLDHINSLKDGFENRGIQRTESAGVVIGIGKGWLDMKNSSPINYRITSSSSPHHHHLGLSSDGPIAEVIRGGHRTEAIRQFSALPGNSNENYWYYNVLIPGKF